MCESARERVCECVWYLIAGDRAVLVNDCVWGVSDCFISGVCVLIASSSSFKHIYSIMIIMMQRRSKLSLYNIIT